METVMICNITVPVDRHHRWRKAAGLAAAPQTTESRSKPS
jgi:hypothetical protein